MIIKLQNLKIIQAIFFIIFAAFIANDQEPDKQSTDKLLVQRLVLCEGWTAPVFADEIAETSDEKSQLIEGIEIQTKFTNLPKSS